MIEHLVTIYLPTLLVILLAILALAEASLFRPARSARPAWIAVIILAGSLAVGATIWQQREANEIADLWPHLAQAVGLSGSPPAAPKEIVDRAVAEIGALTQRQRALQSKVANLERAAKGRVIDEKTAAKLAAFLASKGSYPVVVSCVWGDVEAYDYATQIVDILKRAKWDAHGPEATAMFGAAPTMAINLYVPEGAAPDPAKILVDAFTKFNIPYQTRVPPSSLPEGGAVELFVSRKPGNLPEEGSSR